MIRNLLATTALATLIASGAYAQDTTAPAQPEVAPVEQNADQAATTESVEGHLATNIIGESVFNSTAEDAENIGEVKDIVLDAEGKIEFLVVGVGGFLGIGEKEVAVEFAQAEWAERDGDRWLVVPTTKEQLEAQAEFDPTPYEPEPAAVATDTTAPAGTVAPSGTTTAPADQTATAPAEPVAPATDQPAEETAEVETTEPAEQTAEAPAETAAPADQSAEQTAEAPADTAAPADQQTAEVETVEPADQTAQTTTDPAAPAVTTTSPDTTQTGAIDRSTLQEMPMDQIRAEELIGTTVYGANEETIGEIGDVVLGTEGEGQIDAVLVDVGGFLGIGEKQVAVGMDKLTFMQDENDNRYLYTNFTKEQLEAQPAYDESTYAENRDQQRLIMSE